MIVLEGGMNLDGLIVLIILIMVGPAIILAIIGFLLRKNEKRKAAKVFYIIAGVYLLISLGICGAMMI